MSSLKGNTYRRNLANINVGGSQWTFLALVKCKEVSGSFPVFKGKVHQKWVTEESFGSTQWWVNDDRILIFRWTTEQATVELIKKKKNAKDCEEETQFITFFTVSALWGSSLIQKAEIIIISFSIHSFLSSFKAQMSLKMVPGLFSSSLTL